MKFFNSMIFIVVFADIVLLLSEIVLKNVGAMNAFLKCKCLPTHVMGSSRMSSIDCRGSICGQKTVEIKTQYIVITQFNFSSR